ncbi:MAG: SDR family oxidoreductase [Cyanobacteria bacterium]|nr:SDR family oxidoreductase [Cyanobacteriota bacterium]
MTSEMRQRVLITGASSGIGRATAFLFAQAGMDLVLVSRSQSKLEALAAELQGKGVSIVTHALDLSQLTVLPQQLAAIIADVGPVDVLVNNAGMGYTGALGTMPLADWQRVIDLNLSSVLACIQAVLPGMRQQGQGTIISIASVAAHNAFPDWGAYSVSKAGLVTLSQILAVEEREHGIRVTVVSPGAVNTPLWDTDTVQSDFSRSQMLTPEIVAQAILNAAQLPANAVIDEIRLMPSGGAL